MASQSPYDGSAHSQPILPPQRSRYFQNGITDYRASQNQSRLSFPPPRMSQSPVATASSRKPMAMLPAQAYPHPYFPRAPAAMGYIPQRPHRYPRHPGLQGSIVPLRAEFYGNSNMYDNDGSLASREGQPPRPYSVPSWSPHTPQHTIEHNAHEIPRPTTTTSLAHRSSGTLLNAEIPVVELLSDVDLDKPDVMSAVPPPERTLPFPVRKQAKDTSSPRVQSETSNKNLYSLGKVSNMTQLASKTTTGETTSSKSTQQKKPKASQSKPPKTRADNQEKKVNKRASSARCKDRDTAKPPIRIRLVGQYSFNSKDASHKAVSVSTSTLTPVKKPESLGSKPTQLLSEGTECDDNRRFLRPINDLVGRTGDSSYQCLPKTNHNQAMESEKVPTTPMPISANSHLALTKSLSLHEPGQTSLSKVPTQLSARNFAVHSERLESNTSTGTEIVSKLLAQASTSSVCIERRDSQIHKRSLSQATTASATSTQPPCAAEKKDMLEDNGASNPMSMIDERIINERDLSDIVDIRLQEGKLELLETLQGEILIKMASKDTALYDVVYQILKPTA
ncbi:hypothetical protein F4808DRAFT_103817 [Astrocystis sublimbata]|nr:hypothetical protein F4808DRAFT_103817 [Astrocystis sublimbata]